MRWFVPTQGGSMFLGVQAKSLDDLKTQEQRLSALTGRVHRMAANEREARAVGRHLAEMGVLMEPPGSLHELKVMVLDDPMFAEWAMATGWTARTGPPSRTRSRTWKA